VIRTALGDAASVVNIGAGSGSCRYASLLALPELDVRHGLVVAEFG
jgi:hypothetical protein